eukprot:Nitzschia sp. Nitz4//scaffold322_size40381//17216//18090//NITZ4_007561-RA/size40381-exonerate_est2genome-gene-0.58-mRNA-1//1//CDS//3329547830//1000//frame0
MIPRFQNHAHLVAPTSRHRPLLAKTLYTISEGGVDPDDLDRVVTKHCETLRQYLAEKPIAAHTRATFDSLYQTMTGLDRPVILDSGCGTGRSSLFLGEKYPDHVVVGIDRSKVRLNKNDVYKQPIEGTNVGMNNNVFLVRAELTDFWRLWMDSPLGTVDKHFLLYPNPYPKRKRWMNRWYGHASFPMLFEIGFNEMVLRANWQAYLEDFGQATKIYEKYSSEDCQYRMSGIQQIDASEEPWSNFEAKYHAVGEPVFELKIEKIVT